MNVKVSIIVPVYNTKKYLRKCLDSIVNQTLKEIEIILINDCSTDESIEILREYERIYSEKIIVIDLKENKKPGGARNEGIKIAKGEYIGFVDSDDYIDLIMYEELYKIAKQGNYDMVDCGFDNKSVNKMALSTTRDTWGELDLLKKRQLIAYPGFIWSKIFKRSILIDNNLKFREKVTFEDVDFLPMVILYLKSVYASDLVLYYYRNNSKSITSDSSSNIQIYDKMMSLRYLVQNFKELNAYEDYKDEITFTIYNMYIYMVKYYAIDSENAKEDYEVYKELQEFFFELVKHDYSNNKYILNLDKKKRMYAELNNKDYKMILDTCKTNCN